MFSKQCRCKCTKHFRIFQTKAGLFPARFLHICFFWRSRRKKGNHRNNLAVSAESEGSNFLYFLHFSDLKVQSVASQSAGLIK